MQTTEQRNKKVLVYYSHLFTFVRVGGLGGGGGGVGAAYTTFNTSSANILFLF
jgi:hypothetical protein